MAVSDVIGARERLLAALADRISDITEYLAAGNCESYDAYRFAAGQLNGLLTAQNLFLDMVREEDED